MPKDCCDCRFCRELDEGVKACCEIMDNPSNSDLCRIIDVHYCIEKPDWCPLVPLPEKATEPIDSEDVGKDYSEGTMDGWNACLDAIGSE